MTTKLPASVGSSRFPDDVHYPDSDDEPLPDGRYQEPYFNEIVGAVREHFSDRPDVEVSGNTFIYYEAGNPRRFISPDLHVTLDVTAEGFASMDYRNTYLVWEIGKPADFVLEIASESTARRDVIEKRVLYAQIGFGEYWRFDGTGGEFYGEPLVGEYLGADGQYHRLVVVPDHLGASPRLQPGPALVAVLGRQPTPLLRPGYRTMAPYPLRRARRPRGGGSGPTSGGSGPTSGGSGPAGGGSGPAGGRSPGRRAGSRTAPVARRVILTRRFQSTWHRRRGAAARWRP